MRKITNLMLCSFLYEIAICYTTYDQRQTGDLNIQVELKDIQLFAFMKGHKEEYADYDYAYDYSEMTIKPQHGSKPNTTSTVTATSVTNATNIAPVIEHTSAIGIFDESKINETNVITANNNTNFNLTNSIFKYNLTINENMGT